MTIEFKPWPKTPRLYREIVITEKIDGTNACVVINQLGGYECSGPDRRVISVDGLWFEIGAQSRNRLVTPEQDNAGFANWVFSNMFALVKTLGPGYHYGEWWGKGIQRGYGLDHKRFSLFNTSRFKAEDLTDVPNLDVVPELYRGVFSGDAIDQALDLMSLSSVAAMGQPAEGIIVYHSQSKQVYKVLLENDQQSKTGAGIS